MSHRFAINSNVCKLLGLGVLALTAACQRSPTAVPESTGSTQTITHAMGTTPVSVSPQRVVTIDTTPLDAALALGITPVGTIRYGAPPGYLGEAASNIPVIGQYTQPNLESIVQLNPDLILGAKSISEALYPRLSQIAPTVFTEGAGRHWDWKNNFRLFAKALGQSEQAEQLLADYDQQVETLKASLELPPESMTVSILVSTSDGLVAQTPKSFSGSILEELGFARNPAQIEGEEFFVRISREDLTSPEGDVIFLMHSSEWETNPADEFINDPLWSQLDVVQQGAVCEVAGDVWGSGRSILAANQILTDVEQCLSSEKVN
ncbi:MAG: iron-siderophore ABC transporter substrate-binding protein [Cyanobacteria bacterium P01_H01_bin.162]